MGYLNMIGAFVYRSPVFRTKLDALAENDAFLNSNGWGENTRALFYQAAVPTGWTQVVTQNDKILRVVGPTGGGGAGGSQALSAPVSLSHSHTIPSAGSHTHSYLDHTHFSGPQAVGRQSDEVMADLAGDMIRYTEGPGSDTVTKLKATLATPGAITLGTEAAHDHGGTTGSSLTSVVFAYVDIVVGDKDAPAGTYTDLTSYFNTGDKIDFDPFEDFGFNDEYNKNKLMPSGTILIFGQAAAPTGWTKIGGLNDRMLRVVSGTGGGSGGSLFTSTTLPLSHANSVTLKASHTHSVPAHTHSFLGGDSISNAGIHTITTRFTQKQASGPLLAISADTGTPASRTTYKTSTTSSGSGSTDSEDEHTHALGANLTDVTFAYLDVIQCSKDSGGASAAYTDMSAVFIWKQLVSYQRLEKLSANDEYVRFHTTPAGTKTFFFMATPPSGWTKDTSIDDRALRLVGPTGGGAIGGGAQFVSATIPLAHTHFIPPNANHLHSLSHTHPIATGSESVTPPGTIIAENPLGGHITRLNTVGSFFTNRQVQSTTLVPNEVTADAGVHDHSGVTNSQLADIIMAYADVIYCEKD